MGSEKTLIKAPVFYQRQVGNWHSVPVFSNLSQFIDSEAGTSNDASHLVLRHEKLNLVFTGPVASILRRARQKKLNEDI